MLPQHMTYHINQMDLSSSRFLSRRLPVNVSISSATTGTTIRPLKSSGVRQPTKSSLIYTSRTSCIQIAAGPPIHRSRTGHRRDALRYNFPRVRNRLDWKAYRRPMATLQSGIFHHRVVSFSLLRPCRYRLQPRQQPPGC